MSYSNSVNILGTDYDIATTTYIDLSDENLTSIPDSIILLVNLQRLYLYHNRITNIPDSISSLVNLQRLYLHVNHIDDVSLVSSMSINTTFSNQTLKPASASASESIPYLYLPPVIV